MKTQTLGFKLTFIGILLVLIPLLFAGAFSDIRSSKALDRISKEQVINISQDFAGMVRMVLLERLRAVSLLSAGSTIAGITEKVMQYGMENTPDEIRELDAELARIMKQGGNELEDIFITDAYGALISGGEAVGKNVVDQEYFTSAKKGKPAIGGVLESRKTGLPVVPVCAPVFSASGEITGTLTAVFNFETVSRQILSLKIGKTGYAFMADHKGIIILHPVKEYILTLDIKTLKGMENITHEMLNQKTGVKTYTFRNVHKIAGYAPVGLAGWTIGVTQPVHEFMGSIRDIRIFMAGFFAIFMPLTICMILFFSRKITIPISKVVQGLNSSAAQTSDAAREIAAASQSLAENASEQAASLQETSATLVEISAMSSRTSELTRGGEQLMDENIRKSGHSLIGLVELTQKMHRIEADSDKILEIIKTIDEIAFQTNLLALNAAVEAARAGETGAGFAVVANEVKNLADRSKKAAENTRELLDITIMRVTEAANAIKGINDDFGDIIESATIMGEKTSAITIASKEQAAGIEQISLASSEMEQVTQMMAAHSEETAAASEELYAQSEEMKGFVDDLMFIINGKRKKNRWKDE